MQIQPETIIWNQPSLASKTVNKADVFRLACTSDDRINGSIPVWGKPETVEEDIASKLSAATKSAKPPEFATALAETDTAKKEAFGFFDVLDMINPLQHIPVIGTMYRSMTGDDIKPVSRVIGGAAFGGPIGAAAGIVNALFQIETGKDVADNMIASIEGSDTSAHNDTTIAVANLSHVQKTNTQRTYNS